MIEFSVVDEFQNGDFYRLDKFAWDKEGSGFFGVEGLADGTKKIHLGYGIIISKNTMKVSIFNTICEVKKEW